MDADVPVVGAGAAGIAAARRLRARGRSCLVLEAGSRVGGRAWTDAAGLDLGASWLHVAEVNPLTALARELGFTLHDDGRRRRDLLLAEGGRPATAADRAALEAAGDAWEAAVAARAAQREKQGGPDIPLGEAPPRGGRWDATVDHWFGAIINGIESRRSSLIDYVATVLDGQNLQVKEGIGTLLTRLAEGLPIRLGTRVRRLSAGITADTETGCVQGRAAIVTLGTGVLPALAFDPPLPAAVTQAIAGLPLAPVLKVALRAAGQERFRLPPFARLGRMVEGPDDRPCSWMLWPFGRPWAVAYLGGSLAESLPDAVSAEAAARAELARYFGAAAVARAFPDPATVAHWPADPLFRGSYSYARVGAAGARAVLAEAAPMGGRLRFAGEACHTRYAGTVGGAWESGEAAAEAIHVALG
ncbi:FAD-dependent oxidoreductase [Siccirubricoccus sp. KC 17139]|uniref:Tryptophan 2-monooxygenase n=2 Tax=Siccirubricoccus soli TaxID=2899147 RepID=A0ABT1D4N1_9PROT|nr:FAD-dependent oxidoreductase [Siccirubricoccus soli]MCP2682067.1 FAD-dependent oxidoreductase [Siccirubricoccus soli]